MLRVMGSKTCSKLRKISVTYNPSNSGNYYLSVSGDVCYESPVGISDLAKLPDNQLTASSEYGSGYQAAYGRLNGDRGDGWCAKEAARDDDWLRVDLGKSIEVCGVATQGDRNGNEWTTDFKLSYSADGNTWTTYKDGNGAEVVRLCLLRLSITGGIQN